MPPLLLMHQYVGGTEKTGFVKETCNEALDTLKACEPAAGQPSPAVAIVLLQSEADETKSESPLMSDGGVAQKGTLSSGSAGSVMTPAPRTSANPTAEITQNATIKKRSATDCIV